MYTGQLRRIQQRYGIGWISEAWELFTLSSLWWILGLIAGYLLVLGINLLVELPLERYLPGYRLGGGGSSFSHVPLWLWPVIVISYLIQWISGAYYSAGCLRMALKAMRWENVVVSDVFSGWRQTPRLLGYALIQMLIAALGVGAPVAAIVYSVLDHGNMAVAVATIVASTIVIIAYLVYSTFLMMGEACVVAGTPVFKTLVLIHTKMRPHYGAVLGAYALLSLMLIAGVCTGGIAWFVLVPMWWIMQALIARDTLGVPGAPAELPFEWLPPSEAQPGAWPPPPSV